MERIWTVALGAAWVVACSSSTLTVGKDAGADAASSGASGGVGGAAGSGTGGVAGSGGTSAGAAGVSGAGSTGGASGDAGATTGGTGGATVDAAADADAGTDAPTGPRWEAAPGCSPGSAEPCATGFSLYYCNGADPVGVGCVPNGQAQKQWCCPFECVRTPVGDQQCDGGFAVNCAGAAPVAPNGCQLSGISLACCGG